MDDFLKEFFRDRQTERAMDSSEVWRNYSQAELNRDARQQKVAFEKKIDEENAVLEGVEQFRQKVNASPALKAYLKKAAQFLREYPEVKDKVDPSFIAGLNLLDLEDE